MRAITFLFVDQSSSRPLEKIPTSHEVIGAHMLNFFANIFNFCNFVREGGGPVGVCTNKPWSISNACKNLRGQYPLRAEM